MYLSDVHSKDADPDLSSANPLNDRIREQLQRSAWFTRGWTLQELLAPRKVTFFTSSWQVIGSNREKDDGLSLESWIASITGVPLDVLAGLVPVTSKSVAQRMSWLSKRRTTRSEDLAYCALGIFQVNMPLLYGEADRAWIRLQEEIVRRSRDESIFVWSSADTVNGSTSLLAPHAKSFENCSTVLECSALLRPAYAITNQGLELRLKADSVLEYRRSSDTDELRTIIVPLNCTTGWWNTDYFALWYLTLVEGHCGHFDRAECAPRRFTNDPELDLPGMGPLANDETIYVHTIPSMAQDCVRRLTVHSVPQQPTQLRANVVHQDTVRRITRLLTGQ